MSNKLCGKSFAVRMIWNSKKRMISHCEIILSFCLSASYPMELSSKKQRLKPFSLCPHDFSSRLRQISNRHRLLTLFLTSYKIGANNLENFCLNLFQRSCFSKYFSLAMVQFFKSFMKSSSTCLANCSL